MVVIDFIPGKKQCQIRCDQSIFDIVRTHFSVVNTAKGFVKDPFKKKHLPDRLYAITPTGLFDFGLYEEIRNFLISEQITEITYTEAFRNRCDVGFKNWEFWDGLKYSAYYYQKESLEVCLRNGYGTYLLATGAGKSLLQALLVENLKRCVNRPFKCLILVPGIGLVEQLEQDFLEYGVTFSVSGWSGTKPLQNTEVVICNTENFLNVFEHNPWVIDVDFFIQDEAHKIKKSNNITKLVKKIKTPNRFGFTGSLSDEVMDRWKTIGTFGPVLYEKRSKELRDEKFLTPAQVVGLRIEHSDAMEMKYKDELEFIYNSEERNNVIGKIASGLSNNVLIIVNHLIQGENLLKVLSKYPDKKVYFVNGDMPVEEREKIKHLMETDTNVICIAMASIFATGINIKNIHYIMTVGLGKAFIRLIQTIGRGLRLHPSKERLTIMDVYDNLKYSELHVEERKKIYKREEIPWKMKTILLKKKS